MSEKINPNIVSDITDFHIVYGCPISDITMSDTEEIELRRKLIEEEYVEVMCAIKNRDSENLLKELCDLVYVTVGTAISMGYDFNEAFRRVHESNLSKLGEDGKPIIRDDGKILKGPKYKKADLKDIVDNATKYVNSRRLTSNR